MRIYNMKAWATATSAMSVPETWKTPSAPLAAAVGLRTVPEPEATPVAVASVTVAAVGTTVLAIATVLIVVGRTTALVVVRPVVEAPVTVTSNWPD